MQNPLITIITVSFNDLENFVKTANSVFEQNYENIEYIVVDGGSSDGTIDFIKNNKDKISLYISEKDDGIYDAMNKGIALASGDFICLMNCGDILVSNNVIENIVNKICNDNIDTGSIVYTNFSREGVKFHQPKNLEYYLYIRSICHQSMYIGKDVFSKIGNYDLNYKVTADREHMLRSYKGGIPFIHYEYISCDYLGEGFSTTKKSKAIIKKEGRQISKKYYTAFQLFVFGIRYGITFPKIRGLLSSKRSPLWLRGIYRKIVHLYLSKKI